MKISVLPASDINGHPAMIALVAEGKSDSDKLSRIESLIPELVIGSSRSVSTGRITAIDLGVTRTTAEQSVESE